MLDVLICDITISHIPRDRFQFLFLFPKQFLEGRGLSGLAEWQQKKKSSGLFSKIRVKSWVKNIILHL